MALVTFDTTFELGWVSGTAKPRAFVSNTGRIAGTIGVNTNRVLIGVAVFDTIAAILGTVTMTWNSVSMTPLTSTDFATLRSIYMFGLINPDTGNQTLSVSWTGATNTFYSYLGAVSVFNADQGTGWQNVGTNTGTSTTPTSVVTTTSGNMAIVGHGNNNATTTNITNGTSAWIDTNGSPNAAQAYLASVSGTDTISWTLGTSVEWANLKADIIAAVAADTLWAQTLL